MKQDAGSSEEMTSLLLQLHLEKELRGAAAVAAEQTDTTEVRSCRETRKHTNSSQRDFIRDSEEIFRGQLVVSVQLSLFSVVMKVLYMLVNAAFINGSYIVISKPHSGSDLVSTDEMLELK